MAILDLPVSRWCVTHGELPRFLDYLLNEVKIFEMFGELPGVFLFMTGIFLLDPENRKSLFRFGLAILASSTATAIFKLLIFRCRPRTFFGETFVFPNETVWQSFCGVELIGHPVKETMSFPSGHSACACAFALAMFWLYPRGGILYFFIAFGVMCQRVISGAHYPSDTFVGAAIAFMVGSLVLFPPHFSRASSETAMDSPCKQRR